MKALLKLLFFLFFLFLTIIITGVFLPSEMNVSSSVEIEAKPAIIYPEINNLSRWNAWSPWHTSDSNLIENIKEESGIGIELEWESSIYGNCKVLFTHNQLNESLAANFDFGTDSKSTAVWFIEEVGNSTLVNWTFTTKDYSLWEKYFALFFKTKIKDLLTDGLQQLKVNCEELKFSRVGAISIITSEEVPTVIMVDSVIESKVNERLKEMDRYLLRFFERREMQPAGESFNIKYGQVNDTLVKVARGYPLSERTWVWRTLQYQDLAKGRKVMASHYGYYSSDKAHAAIKRYIQDKGLEQSGQFWEIELFNPVVDKDSTQWETRVYYPVN